MAAKKTGAKVKAKKDVVVEEEEAASNVVVVTEEYLAEHPELIEEGVAVGDTIGVDPEPKKEVVEEPKVKTDAKLDLDGEVAIVKNEEYIRTYPAGNEENVKSFLSKDGKYAAVEPKKILSITVSWRESERKKDDVTGRVVDTGRLLTRTNVFTAANGADWMKKARTLANEGQRRSCIAVIK